MFMRSFRDVTGKCLACRSRRHIWQFRRSALPDFIEGDDDSTPRHPGEMKTLSNILAGLTIKDFDVHHSIDIGLPKRLERNSVEHASRKSHMRLKKADHELEKAARQRSLKVPLDDVYQEWKQTVGSLHISETADYYGIFRDLFNGAHFLPRIPLDIAFDYDGELCTPVYRGNHIKASEAVAAPRVHFESDAESLWTLVLTNPDGHLQDNSSEYLHWMVGNIPGNNIEQGQVICDYMQPFPPKGTGFHRFVFILYKQEGAVDYSVLQRSLPCSRLNDRTFKTFNFYMDRQDVLTPAGLAFFQCNYDDSLRDFFHHTLRMREPVFEYDFPTPYVRPQARKPEGKPFNLYLDKYRDPKDIEKEILLKRLQSVHPFEGEPRKPKYPNIQPIPWHYPSWLKTEVKKERFRIGKYRGLDIEICKPERPKRVVLGIYKSERAANSEQTFGNRKSKS